MNNPQTTQAKLRQKRGPLAIIGTSKALIYFAAGLSFVLSVSLWFSGDRERGLFVGLWVPSILSAGTLLLSTEDHVD